MKTEGTGRLSNAKPTFKECKEFGRLSPVKYQATLAKYNYT